MKLIVFFYAIRFEAKNNDVARQLSVRRYAVVLHFRRLLKISKFTKLLKIKSNDQEALAAVTASAEREVNSNCQNRITLTFNSRVSLCTSSCGSILPQFSSSPKLFKFDPNCGTAQIPLQG